MGKSSFKTALQELFERAYFMHRITSSASTNSLLHLFLLGLSLSSSRACCSSRLQVLSWAGVGTCVTVLSYSQLWWKWFEFFLHLGWCQMWVSCILLLSCWAKSPILLISPGHLSWMNVKFCQQHFLNLMNWYVVSVLYSICVADCIHWLTCVESSLLYNLLNLFMNMVCNFFIENFCLCSSKVFYYNFCWVLSGFGIKVLLALLKTFIWKCPFPFYFAE